MKSTRRKLKLILAVLFVAVTAGCGGDDSTAPPVVDQQFDGPATLANRIGRTNEFALDLFHQLADSEDNLVVSPHSIVTCFGMAYAGARGHSEREIADVLRFNYPQQGFHSVLEELNRMLMNRPGITLKIANGCWGAEGMTYLQEYMDTLSTAYDADLDTLDFAGDPEGARQTVNDWVKSHTMGKITELFPPDSFDDLTYLVLANTVYFFAEWLHQFNPDYTWPDSFTRLDSSKVSVDVMNGEHSMPYYEGNGYRAMEMPYTGGSASMVLIVPDEGNYKNFESGFTTSVFDNIAGNLASEYITFKIPKFGYFSKYGLIPTLEAMGMTGVFAPGADFSGMDGTDDGVPWIDQVVHKAYIQIDEYGTLAVAATGMELTLGIHNSLDARRPFIYVIRDIDTGTILFMGRVLDPTLRQEN